MNLSYRIFSIIFLLTPCFPLLTAAHAAASDSRAEYDCKSAHVESDAHASQKLLTTPPSEQELKKSYLAAEQARNGTDGLIALCQPYVNHNPDIFAVAVFQKFLEICKGKNGQPGWFKVSIEKVELHDILTQTIRVGLAQELPGICAAAHNPILWCCLGIVSSYAALYYESNGLPLIHTAGLRKITRDSYQYIHAYREAPYKTIEKKHKNYWYAQCNLPQLKAHILEATTILPELANIIIDYCHPQFGQTMEEHRAQLPPEEQNKFTLHFEASLVYDLAGLRDAIASAIVELPLNLIERIRSIDLQSSAITSLNLAYNRIRTLPAEAFAGLKAVQLLRLQSNQLTSLTRAMFAGCNQLRELHLANNLITIVEDGTFAQLPHLRTVHMQNNKLEALPADFQEMADRLEVLDALSDLNLDGNPLLTDSTENEKYQKLKKQIQANGRQRQQALLAVTRTYALAAPTSVDSDSAGVS
jgi:hypothetical protein